MGDMHADAHKRSDSLQQHMHAATTWPFTSDQTTHLNTHTTHLHASREGAERGANPAARVAANHTHKASGQRHKLSHSVVQQEPHQNT